MKKRNSHFNRALAVFLTALIALLPVSLGASAFAFYTRSTAMTVCNSSASRGTSTRLDVVNDGGTGSTSFVMLKFENSVVASAAAQSKISLGLKAYTCSAANGSQAAVYYTDDVSKAANYWTFNYNSSTHVSKTMQSLTGGTEKGGTEAMNGVISFFGLKKLDTFAQPKGVTSTPGDYNVYADVTEAVYSANAAVKDLYLFILIPDRKSVV